MTIQPFSIGSNGEPKKSVAVDALYHPNKIDSSVSFFEKLAVSTLVQKKTYILVWRREGKEAKPGGQITPNNIAGFTFLEYPTISRLNGKTNYTVGENSFTEDEVIVIPGGVDPKDLYGGYSPSEAARRWATLDDYIADYQAGFFENGAVPAGQFIITAPSAKEFDDIVNTLQARHRGAGKNGNVTYSHRPIDKETGKPSDAQLEWIPFQQSNKDIDFKNLFEQANKRIDSAFGVPASIRGVGENNNYATARLDQQNFIRFTVKPLATRIYTTLTHELNRITNGLGVAITFELELPAVADEQKVQAETKQIELNMIVTGINNGFTLESTVEALKLSNSYKLLKTGTSTETKIDNDKPNVDEGGEVNESPDPEKVDGITAYNEAANRPNPKAELTDYDKLYAAARQTMKRQINKAVEEITEDDITNELNPDPTLDEENEFVDDMMLVITGILISRGVIQYSKGKELLESAGIDTDNLTEFILPEAAETRYRMYLSKVATSYMTDTANAIRKVLSNAVANELSLAETKKSLRSIMDTDEYRIKRIAETELNRSQAMGSIESMREIQAQTGVRIQKGLLHGGSDAPCEFCQVLLNKWVDVDQDFILEGEAVIGADGGVYLNNFAANEGYDIHPNGHCSPEYRVVQ
jgi:phage portal protein BeeE